MTTTTIAREITDEQLEALREEAAAAGDEEMRGDCDRAIAGCASARRRCAAAVAAAAAAADEHGARG